MTSWINDTYGDKEYPLLNYFFSTPWDYNCVYENYDGITKTNILGIIKRDLVSEIGSTDNEASAIYAATEKVDAVLDKDIDGAILKLEKSFKSSSLDISDKREILKKITTKVSLLKRNI
jgi:hypothetical protein